MINAGIKEVKNNLSKILARVKTGEEVVITDRGKPIARILKENQDNRSIREALAPLIEKGLVVLPVRSISKKQITPVNLEGKPVAEMVLEDRR